MKLEQQDAEQSGKVEAEMEMLRSELRKCKHEREQDLMNIDEVSNCSTGHKRFGSFYIHALFFVHSFFKKWKSFKWKTVSFITSPLTARWHWRKGTMK